MSVTVIATGFGQEQQNEISNTEAKKIIHTLEDEQKMEHDLSEKKDLETDEVSVKFDEPAWNKFTPTQAIETTDILIDRDPLIDLNAILYDIEVDCEIVPNGIPEKQVHVLSEEEEGPYIFPIQSPNFYIPMRNKRLWKNL